MPLLLALAMVHKMGVHHHLPNVTLRNWSIRLNLEHFVVLLLQAFFEALNRKVAKGRLVFEKSFRNNFGRLH